MATRGDTRRREATRGAARCHEAARNAIVKEGWNRVTASAKGNVVKTWINGVPCSNWVGDGEFEQGFFALQVHKGESGTVLFKNLMIKEFE